jgi:hypothetical protein
MEENGLKISRSSIEISSQLTKLTQIFPYRDNGSIFKFSKFFNPMNSLSMLVEIHSFGIQTAWSYIAAIFPNDAAFLNIELSN